MNDPYTSTAAALFCAAVGRLDGQRQVGAHPGLSATFNGIPAGAVREAMVRRALEPDQWTYAEMSRVAERAGGNERNADKFNQTLRRENHATPYRDGKRVFWTLTAAGRAALTSEIGS